MLDRPFLTQIDPRAKIKGSRDPLGLQPIWSRLGRRLVRNLTTVTTSLRGFTTLLLGLYIAECVTEDAPAAEDEFLAAFLKFEQLAAYSRVALSQQSDGAYSVYSEDDENAIRGIRRVVRNLNETRGKVGISANFAEQILANQKTYGLWGLYSVAARNSGCLEAGSARLTAPTRDFIEMNYRSRLQSTDHNADVFKLFKNDFAFEPKGKHTKLARNLAELLSPRVTAIEREFYYMHLIMCASEHADDIQERLWKQFRKLNPGSLSYTELVRVIDQSHADGDEVLYEHLDHIRATEAVIAPASRLFGFLLAQDGQSIDSIAQDIRASWGDALRHIQVDQLITALSVLGDGIDAVTRERMHRLAKSLNSGKYGETIELLLEQNRAVMQERGGNAWVILKDGRIDVRMSAEAGNLPPARDIPTLWMHNYFLNSLKQIGFEIDGGA